MKIGEALAAYRAERKLLVQQRRELFKQKESLERKMRAAEGGAGNSMRRRPPPWNCLLTMCVSALRRI